MPYPANRDDLTESFRGEIEEIRVWSVARTDSELTAGETCAFFESPLPETVRAQWRFHGDLQDSSSHGNEGSPVYGASLLRTESAFPTECTVQDLDTDGIADAADNCPLDANADQVDGDGDGWGDPCDLCGSIVSLGQVDQDRDGVGDECDNCPFRGNTEQVDADADGTGDLCDPAPADGASGVPDDGIQLSLDHDAGTGETTITWSSVPLAATYEVYRGARDEVADGFFGTCQNSRDPDTSDTSFLEAGTPPAGESFYFLVVGVNSGGTRGLAGSDSVGRQRDLRAKDCL
jgi:hypothetical protein